MRRRGGVAYDTSGNGNDGTINGASWGRGKYGSGLEFDGVDDYVDLGEPSDLKLNFPFTYSAWVNLEPGADGWVYAYGNQGTCVNNGYRGSGIKISESYFNAYFHSGSGLSCLVGDRKRKQKSLSISTNTWHHVAASYINHSDIRLYINGIDVGGSYIGEAETVGYGSGYPLEIGASYTTSQEDVFSGVIDQIRVYDYARTPAQIAWDYNKGKPVAHYEFDECGGSVIHDESENGVHGVLNLGSSGTVATGTCASSSDSFWYNGRSGKRKYSASFDGTDDYINIGDTGLNINSVSFWMKQDYTDNYMIDLGGGNYTITLADSVVTTAGFSSPTIYVDGINKTSIPDNAWHHILVTSATAIDASSTKIGLVGSDYFSGQIDELKLYNYDLTGEQAKTDFSGSAVGFGYSGLESGSALVSSWTCGSSQLEDVDGNLYDTVQINDQCWMAENMRTIKYPDGSAITKGSATNGDAAWGTDQAWYSCPPNSSNNGEDCDAAESLGMLYQWSAAMDGASASGSQGICPTGWHLPTDAEWHVLEDYLDEGTCNGSRDGSYDCSPAGSKLAGNDAADANWTAGTLTGHEDFDTSGFNAPPAGYRDTGGLYNVRAFNGVFWSSSEAPAGAWYRSVYYLDAGVGRGGFAEAFGFSVRCLKN